VNLLVTGSGSSGSWAIRGEQLGKAIGATVQAKALDVAAYDAAIVVKRPPADLVARIHAARIPLIWDVVDAWPQPVGNTWGRDECMAWLRQQVRQIRPAGIVAATWVMADDCREFGVPVVCVPHHCRPMLDQNPIRERVQAVGYEGGEGYITGWRSAIEAQCKARGWRFVVNPPSLAQLDIVLALRDATGYAPRQWKSGVKLSNAQGSGTPFIGGREAGYLAQAIGNCERWADAPEELAAAFDSLAPLAERRRVSGWMLSAAPRLDAVAADYAGWLSSVVAVKATACDT
jgi:hypothetical protein